MDSRSNIIPKIFINYIIFVDGKFYLTDFQFKISKGLIFKAFVQIINFFKKVSNGSYTKRQLCLHWENTNTWNTIIPEIETDVIIYEYFKLGF